jgi:hypothetical protein
MDAKATVRVRASEEGAGQRPDRARLERVAELLTDSGFVVLRVGRFGVNIQGDEQIFERELGVSLQGVQPMAEAPHPQSKELSKLIDLVEVAGTPLSFSTS